MTAGQQRSDDDAEVRDGTQQQIMDIPCSARRDEPDQTPAEFRHRESCLTAINAPPTWTQSRSTASTSRQLHPRECARLLPNRPTSDSIRIHDHHVGRGADTAAAPASSAMVKPPAATVDAACSNSMRREVRRQLVFQQAIQPPATSRVDRNQFGSRAVAPSPGQAVLLRHLRLSSGDEAEQTSRFRPTPTSQRRVRYVATATAPSGR